jgi:hypothetical protein
VYCVLCTVYCVLCTVYCVLCTVHCVLCTVYCVLLLCPVYCVSLYLLSVCLFVCLSLCLFLCLSVCPSICLSVYESFCLVVHLSSLSGPCSPTLPCLRCPAGRKCSLWTLIFGLRPHFGTHCMWRAPRSRCVFVLCCVLCFRFSLFVYGRFFCVLPRGHCCCCLLVCPCSDNA